MNPPDLGTAADYELMLRFLVRYKITSAYLSEIVAVHGLKLEIGK
jgi:hypothetical protein